MIFSGSAITSKNESMSIPVIVTDLIASPRRAKPGPDTTGVTPMTPGIFATSARTFCHWSTERSCCERGWICAATLAGPLSRNWRATWSGARISIGAWKLSVRRTMFACMPAKSADMKMITPAPSATPKMISSVCVSPSRMKRNATIVSNRENGFITTRGPQRRRRARAGQARRRSRPQQPRCRRRQGRRRPRHGPRP